MAPCSNHTLFFSMLCYYCEFFVITKNLWLFLTILVSYYQQSLAVSTTIQLLVFETHALTLYLLGLYSEVLVYCFHSAKYGTSILEPLNASFCDISLWEKHWRQNYLLIGRDSGQDALHSRPLPRYMVQGKKKLLLPGENGVGQHGQLATQNTG